MAGRAVRPQHPAGPGAAGDPRAADGAQPARGQPAAAHPRPVPAGDQREHPGRVLAAVHDPRLVHPRGGRHLAPGRHPAARPATTGPRTRCGSRGSSPTRPGPAGAEGPITTVNDVTHWWDGSSLYGSSLEEQQPVRAGEGGRLRLTDDGQLPIPDDPALDPTMKPGWWTGMGMLLTLFAREHNAVCARLGVGVPALGRRGAVPARPAGGRRPAGEDPHRRVDAGGHQPPDDGVRAAGQLVRRRGGADRPRLRPDQRQRGHQRHPGRGDRALRRPVLADRGVHQRLPDAPAAARRLRPADGGRRQPAGAAAASGSSPARTRRRSSTTLRASATSSTRSGRRTPARSCCATTRSSCRSTSGRTAR